jgi:hypothetical protein
MRVFSIVDNIILGVPEIVSKNRGSVDALPNKKRSQLFAGENNKESKSCSLLLRESSHHRFYACALQHLRNLSQAVIGQVAFIFLKSFSPIT